MGRFVIGDSVRVSGPLHPEAKGTIGTVTKIVGDPAGMEKLDRYFVQCGERTECFWSTELESAGRIAADVLTGAGGT
jgi:hypothetical protein